MSSLMDPIPPFLAFLAVSGYAAAAALIWRHLRAGAPLWPAPAASGLALVFHLWLLIEAATIHGGLSIGVGLALSLFAWQASLLLWVFALREPIHALGLAVYPVTAVCVLLGVAAPSPHPPSVPLGWPMQTHILLSLLAYGVLTLGAVQALALAIQHRRLHDHRPGGPLAGLPPLQTMETLLFRLLSAGFFLLTLAILSGALFVDDLFGQHLVHKTVLSIAAWVAFAILLWGRWQYGWRGRVAVRWTLGAYIALILAYFGSKLVLEWVLGRHW